MRIKPDGPLVMVFNDHRRDALTMHGKEMKVRRPAQMSACASCCESGHIALSSHTDAQHVQTDEHVNKKAVGIR